MKYVPAANNPVRGRLDTSGLSSAGSQASAQPAEFRFTHDPIAEHVDGVAVTKLLSGKRDKNRVESLRCIPGRQFSMRHQRRKFERAAPQDSPAQSALHKLQQTQPLAQSTPGVDESGASSKRRRFAVAAGQALLRFPRRLRTTIERNRGAGRSSGVLYLQRSISDFPIGMPLFPVPGFRTARRP